MDLDAHAPSGERPLPFSIDLNETPSPSSFDTHIASTTTAPTAPPPPATSTSTSSSSNPADAYFLARWFHAMPGPAVGPPAEFPGEAGAGPSLLPCAACGRPETRGSTLVCDSCDRGFHLGCARVRVRQLATAADWVCGDCVLSGRRSERWDLGRVISSTGVKGTRTPPPLLRWGRTMQLDMNALPPTDGETDAAGAMQQDDNNASSLKANGHDRQLKHPDLVYMGNGVHLQDPGTMNKILSPQVSHQKGLPLLRGLQSGLLGSSLAAIPLANNMALKSPSELEQDIFLQSLKEFVSEKQGSLGEGWHVDFRKCNRYNSNAVYCAPDGRRFNSICDVANYLRMTSSICFSNMDGKGEMPGSVHRTLTRRRRRKELARLVGSNNHTDHQESMRNSCGGEASETDDKQFSAVNGDNRVDESMVDDDVSIRYPQPDVQLPVQFEDFFIISLGKIDSRPSYHNSSQIWPVGYESCWHDRVTGSIFKCQVSDGGDAGPLFCIKRYPCSSLSIPAGETILVPSTSNNTDVMEAVDHELFTSNLVNDEEDEIQLLLADPSPVDLELLSSLSNGVAGACVSEKSLVHLNRKSGTGDEIGELSTEGKSTSAVWGVISRAFIDACCDVFRKFHGLQFQCKHIVSTHFLDCHSSLAKFSYAAAPPNLPQIITNESDLEGFCHSIAQWLNQDRFGLDVSFVQEFMEKLPGAKTCAQYELLSDRSYYSTAQTVGSGMLVAKYRIGESGEGKCASHIPHGEPEKREVPDQSAQQHSLGRLSPCGRPLRSRIPAELVGDVLQIWELFGRFYQILGLQEPLSFEKLEEELIDPWSCSPNCAEKEILDTKETSSQGTDSARSLSGLSATESDSAIQLETTFIQVETESMKEAAHSKLASLSYGRCTGFVLTKAHISLLKVLVGELQCRVAVFADPTYDGGEPKSKRGRRREPESSISIKKSKINMLPLNELTWPEMARRYVLAVSSMDFNQDSAEVCSREGSKVFRCLQGDGGILCGSMTGVAGMEADALLLAEAGRQISVSVNHDHVYFPVESKESEDDTVPESTGIFPEWAQVLEPVRKLPTNVGTRIRKCVYESLERNPPEWARKILEHSISKEVYKGNASGPTKKAVLSLLAEVSGETSQQKPKEKEEKHRESLSNLIMRLCRVVLRRSMAADEAKVFCNLLGTTLLNSNENDDEGILGSPGQISRPLDFRSIDLRLAVGAYGVHHKAFLEDVRELWHDIRMVYRDRPDLIELAESLSQNFESLYETEVQNLVQEFSEVMNSEGLNTEVQKKVDNLLSSTNEMPKAPWEDGVCKVCGIDKDDDSVLLCDTCDSEYHTYCLDPPLSRIPAGNWYCPSCVAGQSKIRQSSSLTETQKFADKQLSGSKNIKESLRLLAVSLGKKEYWDLSLEERIFLLKFLCDEVLNSIIIREKLDQCMEVTSDLQVKLRTLAVEWRELKLKENALTTRMEKSVLLNGLSDDVQGEPITHIFGSHDNTLQQNSSGRHRQYNASLESQENESGSSIDRNLNQRILRSMKEKNFNGNASQLCHLHGVSQSRIDIDHHSDGNVETLLSTRDSSREESCQIGDQIHRASKRQRTDGFQNHSDSTVISNMEKGVPFVKCSKILDERAQLSDSGNMHLDDVGVSTPLIDLATSIHENSLLQDNCNVPSDMTDMHPCKEELDSLKNEILVLQDKVANIESQIFMASIRRDFIGRDSFGRIFWSMGRPGRRPWLLVDGTIRVPPKRDGEQSSDFTLNGHSGFSVSIRYANSHTHDESLRPWMIYESDNDIEDLMSWLSDSDTRERELKECILQWQKVRSSQTWNQLSDEFAMVPKCQTSEQDFPLPYLLSKASVLLEKNYGPCLEMELNNIPKKHCKKAKSSKETRMFRCECLEPVWPTRHHCLFCHQTFASSEELEGHNDGKCTLNISGSEEYRENDTSIRGKGTRMEVVLEKEQPNRACVLEVSKYGNLDINSRLMKVPKRACPYDLEEICQKFVTKDSNKELVREIGLIGSNGFPTLIESPPSYFNDSVVMVSHDAMLEAGFTFLHRTPVVSTKEIMLTSCDNISSGLKNVGKSTAKAADSIGLELSMEQACTLDNTNSQEIVSQVNKPLKQDGSHRCIIPESSLRPLSGKVSEILKRLKMNLLDMDAALPAEALRSSMMCSGKRCVWRAFVRSVESIYEMVQASVLFEGMIRAEYLKNERWYWSSLTAAARTPTISSLALRIYSLDASIIYSKAFEAETGSTDNPKSSNRVGKRRKEMDGGT